MKPKPHKPEAWRTSNPSYQPSKPKKIRINGVPCVEIDGGLAYDMAQTDKREAGK